MDTQKRIDQLCKSLDDQTEKLYADTPGKLLLLGQKDSIFLKAIKRKADSMGLVCDFGRVSPPYTGVVADTEFPAQRDTLSLLMWTLTISKLPEYRA